MSGPSGSSTATVAASGPAGPDAAAPPPPPPMAPASAPGVARALLAGVAVALGGLVLVALFRLSAPGAADPVRAALSRLAGAPADARAVQGIGEVLTGAFAGAGPALWAVAAAALGTAALGIARAPRAGATGGTARAAMRAQEAATAGRTVPETAGAAASGPIGSGGDGAAGAAAERDRGARARRAGADARAELAIALSEIERLRTESAARELELESMRTGRSRFVARISHGLRTPLNGILGMAGMVAVQGIDDAERARRAARLTSSARNLLGVVNGMLDHALLENGELRLQRSRFGLHETIEEGCQRRGAEAHARGVELVCYIDDDVPRDVDGDGERVWQVVDALVANAIEHTERGEVVVRVVRDGPPGAAGPSGPDEAAGTRSRYRCDVQDSGSGLSPESQLALWRAFRGGEGATRDAPDGVIEARPSEDRAEQGDGSGGGTDAVLGLGLRTASELARRMGGGLDVRSRLGEGSRFSFAFELGDVEQRERERSAGSTLRGIRALVIDDNETNRTILGHQLGNWGMSADCADGGPAALEALVAATEADAPFEVLVLDLHMPGMDGLELARRIVADPRIEPVPALMLTSSEVDLDAAELDALGIERNLTKPARQSVLHDTLASMVRREGAAREPGVRVARSVPVGAVPVGATPGGPVPQEPASEDETREAASGPEPASRPAGLDPDALAEIRALERPEKPGLVARIVEVWRTRAPELARDMRAALEPPDPDAIGAAVHELRSSGGYLGATEVVARCRELEEALVCGETDPERLAGLVDAVDEACEAAGLALVEVVGRAA